MKGNVLSSYFRHLSTLCAGKKKMSLQTELPFQVYVDKKYKFLEAENGVKNEDFLSFSCFLV